MRKTKYSKNKSRKKRAKTYAKNGSRKVKIKSHSKNRSIWKRLKYVKKKGIILGVVWFLTLLFILPILLSFSIASVGVGIQSNVSVPYISFMSLSVLFSSFFLGIAIFAGYIEFTHERRAGTIVFFGKTKY